PYDVVRVGDTYGSVFELLKAGSFAKIAANHPERLDELTREFVKLMKQIHSTEVKPGDMPSMKNVAQNWAKDIRGQLPEDKQAKLERMLEEIPDCHTMLHGDYHFKNVMEQNGEILLVDMDTLCQGHPIFEFASTYLGFVGFGAIDPDVTYPFMGLPYETTCRIWNKVLDLYFEGESDETRKAVESKARIIAYVRLLRRTLRREPENVKRLAFCKDNLNVLLDTVSSLTF
ncbi:MAG: phosphotransferase, partial [Clostridia bacterium]|nr:phosphotransferase [Clostridia bacterium]